MTLSLSNTLKSFKNQNVNIFYITNQVVNIYYVTRYCKNIFKLLINIFFVDPRNLLSSNYLYISNTRTNLVAIKTVTSAVPDFLLHFQDNSFIHCSCQTGAVYTARGMNALKKNNSSRFCNKFYYSPLVLVVAW